jgi:predicted metal-dependent enzyme (double-stranded beta helix superfamily)
MTQTIPSEFQSLKPKLDAAVAAPDVTTIAHQIKTALQDVLRYQGLSLPERYHTSLPDTYARRLLHRDPAGRYTVVVMTWGPGQKTALHDHAGIWCVECVVDGEMEITQYDLVSDDGEHYRFSRQKCVAASRGAAGCLIPPFEYHTLANARPDHSSITMHVYGGEMDHCHVFEPAGDGTWARRRRELRYHE